MKLKLFVWLSLTVVVRAIGIDTQLKSNSQQFAPKIISTTKDFGESTVGACRNAFNTIAGFGKEFGRPIDSAWSTTCEVADNGWNTAKRVGS